MNGYGDPDVAGRDGREFDPREASELLERATEQARRVSTSDTSRFDADRFRGGSGGLWRHLTLGQRATSL